MLLAQCMTLLSAVARYGLVLSLNTWSMHLHEFLTVVLKVELCLLCCPHVMFTWKAMSSSAIRSWLGSMLFVLHFHDVGAFAIMLHVV